MIEVRCCRARSEGVVQEVLTRHARIAALLLHTGVLSGQLVSGLSYFVNKTLMLRDASPLTGCLGKGQCSEEGRI